MTTIPTIPDIVLPPEVDNIPANKQPKTAMPDDFQELMQAMDLPIDQPAENIPKQQKKSIAADKQLNAADMMDVNAVLQTAQLVQPQPFISDVSKMQVNSKQSGELSSAVSTEKSVGSGAPFKKLSSPLETIKADPVIQSGKVNVTNELLAKTEIAANTTQTPNHEVVNSVPEVKLDNQQVMAHMLSRDIKSDSENMADVMQTIEPQTNPLKKQQLIDSNDFANKTVKKAISIDMHLSEIPSNSKVVDDVIAVTTNQPVSIEKLTSEQENKYYQAITQLSHAINAQTAPEYKASLPLGLASSSNASESTYIRESVPHDVQFNVELQPQTLDSLAKQTYDAKIKIYPPELGHVTASLRIEKNSAELTIIAQNDHVKGIIESNLPQLRQNFQQADITLTNIQVQTSVLSNKDTGNQNQQTNNPNMPSQQDELDNKQANNQKQNNKPNSLVDTYA